MTLMERLLDDMKTAMKSKDQLRLSVIRLAKAAMMNLQIARGHDLSEQEVIEVLAKEAKQRQDSIPEYEKAGRADIVETLRNELKIIQEYLPAQLSEDEIRELVKTAIAETGATGKKDMGKVMGALMPKTKGRADGKLVNQIVNSLLGD